MCVYVMQFYCTFDIFKEWINMMSAVLKAENPDPFPIFSLIRICPKQLNLQLSSKEKSILQACYLF